jgi:hypothetical protein
MMDRLGRASGPVASLVAAAALLRLLHRSLGRAGASPEFLLIGIVRDFGPFEWVLVLGTCVACGVAVVKREHRRLLHIQMWSLAAGLLLTHFKLGSEVGEKVDPRFVFTIIAGAASLHCCYVCLLAYAAMAFSRRRAV